MKNHINKKTGTISKGCFLILTASLASPSLAADLPENPIRLNTVGYLPNHEKKASIAVKFEKFSVIAAKDNKTILDGAPAGPFLNRDTGEQLYIADFSALTQEGQYILQIDDGPKSAPFTVSKEIYNTPFDVVMRGMYLWRCGTAVDANWNGNHYHHDACHIDDAWLDLATGQHEKVESTRGWHDAGDYNKYVVNAGVTVGCMLRAYSDFPAIAKWVFDSPEKQGKLPSFLAEVKWETDWLLTMQADDGSVYVKVSTKNFGAFIMPEKETDLRYFVPSSTAATADNVAMLAMASRAFQTHDKAYAEKCLASARKSYDYLKKNPQNRPYDPKGVTTGGYETNDVDDRLWAAAELWETTGDPDVLKELETRISAIQARVDRSWDWGNVNNLGLLTYEFSTRAGRNPALVNLVKTNLIASADDIVKARNDHGYARPLGTAYSWGGNGTVARQTLNLMAANKLNPDPKYVETALDALNHLFGRNYYGRSFVTGLGFEPPMNPHDRRSGGDDIKDPWPGYLVGGPNPQATSWKDIQDDYRNNEIAINWNGALIYALAAFVTADNP